MKLIYGVLFAVLMGTAMSASAENMVMRDEKGNVLTLHSEKCSASPWTKDWFTASFFYQGKQYKACWRLQGNTVVVLDDAGDVTPLPMAAFKPETGV